MAVFSPHDLLRFEFIQRRDEGCRIPEALDQAFAELDKEKDFWNYAAVGPVYDELMRLPADPELAAREPNELDAIRSLRPAGPRDLAWRPSDSELGERLHGAWTGRCLGCALGKPVEGLGIMGHGAFQGPGAGRRAIKAYLQARGDWPLRDFFSGREAEDGLAGYTLTCPSSHRERIAYMEPDDDVHYSMVGLGVIEERGPGFTWNQVANYWLVHIPMVNICTAEAQAILNFMNRSDRLNGPATPAFCRRYRNPFREWIGAQIRADGWAWCAAGRPELAAEFAWRDACWTHERNGIYGEMLFAAIQAAAFVERDPRRLVEIGLSEIPAECRLARAIRQMLAWIDLGLGWEACMERLEAAFPGMIGIHTINNAALCVLSLCHREAADPLGAVAMAVMAGLDTDCNGATVGSVVGAAGGAAALRTTIARRLNDRVKPAMIGFQDCTLAELAERTAVQWKRVDAWVAARGRQRG